MELLSGVLQDGHNSAISHNKNLQFHMKDKWEDEKFIDSDPRNNMVEPKLVIDKYKKLDKN
jgi:hypothetical protein